MTPYEIVMLIDCYTGSDLSAADTPLREQTLHSFITNELIEKRDGRWQATERTKVYIDHLCGQPWPVRQWIIPTQGKRADEVKP